MTPVRALRGELDRCWPWIEEAIERFGHTHTKEHIWREIISQQSLFFPGDSAAFVCKIIDYPTGLRVGSCWLAGGDLGEIKETVPALEEFGRRRGCKMATLTGRWGWLRALDGYRVHNVRMAKDL